MENNLSLRDKRKCPFCGGTVINTGVDFFCGDVDIIGLRTDAEWICTNCKTEFDAEFDFAIDEIKKIHNLKATFFDRCSNGVNVLGESSNRMKR